MSAALMSRPWRMAIPMVRKNSGVTNLMLATCVLWMPFERHVEDPRAHVRRHRDEADERGAFDARLLKNLRENPIVERHATRDRLVLRHGHYPN